MHVSGQLHNGPDSINVLVVGATRGLGLGLVNLFLNKPNVGRVFASHRGCVGQLAEISDPGQKLGLVSIEVTDPESWSRAADLVSSQVGKLHVVIYCVGILHGENFKPEKKVSDLDAKILGRLFQVNSIGAVLLAKSFEKLLRHSEPSILAALSARVGSITDNHLGGWYGYRASKAALNMFFKTLAIEFRRSHPNCCVVLLHPGTTDTLLSKPFQVNVKPEKLFSVDLAVRQLDEILEDLNLADSGKFFAWDGEPIPW